MVSPLSARLLTGAAGFNSTKGSDGPPAGVTAKPQPEPKQRKKRIPPYAMIPGSVGGSSGYLADLDNIKASTAVLPITSIDLVSKMDRHAGTPTLDNTADKKRSKPTPDEVTYMASRAREDIKKVGMQVPKIQVKRPRMFPPRSSVDMSKVTLLSAKSVEKFPLLIDVPGLFCTSAVYSDSPDQLDALLKDSRAWYNVDDRNKTLPIRFQQVVEQIQRQEQEHQRKESEKEQSSSDSASSTSSFTVSDTGNEATIVNPDFSLNVLNACASPSKNSILPSTESSSMISIGEALSISKNPRLLVLGSEPFTVVQANAAFHCLANCSDFLGKPLKKIVEDESLHDVVEEVAVKHKRVVKEKHTLSVQKVQKEVTVYVSPVGPCDGELTHLSIELHCDSDVAGPKKLPFQVMG